MMGWDGFDAVELVMSVEDNLNISIPNNDAEKLITAGDLLAYLIRRLNAVPTPASAVCRSARIFRESRKRLTAKLGYNSRQIRPSTPTEDLLPPLQNLEARHQAWAQICNTLKISTGRLQMSRKIQKASGLILLLSPAGLILLTKVPRDILPAVLYAYLIACAVLLFSLYCFGRKYASELPNGFETIGELVGQARLTKIQDHPKTHAAQWTHAELWELIQDLTALSAGISPTKITRDTQFMELP